MLQEKSVADTRTGLHANIQVFVVGIRRYGAEHLRKEDFDVENVVQVALLVKPSAFADYDRK